jgi:hypothetical protein
MKKPNRQMMVMAAGLAAGAITALFVSKKGKKSSIHRGDSWIGKCNKQKLEMVKGKLETHKIRLERAIGKINTRLGELEA